MYLSEHLPKTLLLFRLINDHEYFSRSLTLKYTNAN